MDEKQFNRFMTVFCIVAAVLIVFIFFSSEL